MSYFGLVVLALLALGLGIILKKFVPELHVFMCVLLALLVLLLLYIFLGVATGTFVLTV